VPSVVLGAKTLAQLADNLAAKPLAAEHVKALDDASHVPKPYPYEMVERVNAGRAR